MQRFNCAAGAVVFIGHARVETVDVPPDIRVDFSVAFDGRFTYCGLAGPPGMAGPHRPPAWSMLIDPARMPASSAGRQNWPGAVILSGPRRKRN